MEGGGVVIHVRATSLELLRRGLRVRIRPCRVLVIGQKLSFIYAPISAVFALLCLLI